MSLTQSQTNAELNRLARKTSQATDAQKKADQKLLERDEKAATLADQGVRYVDLAEAMGITVDGVTYVLRKVRQRRAQQ